MRPVIRAIGAGLGLLILLSMAGCRSIGPSAIENDRFDYNTAIANSWKKQTLLNIVKLRYADMPLFVEVNSIVSGYTLERAVSVNGTISSKNAVQGDWMGAGASGRFTDRPTITYSPLSGKTFTENFMMPIPPQSILFMIQNGWAADVILGLTVDSMNGLRSRTHAGVSTRSGDLDFYRCIELMRELQKSGSIGMRIIDGENKKTATVVFIHKKGMEQGQKDIQKELWKLLGLNPDADQLNVRYGSVTENDAELAVLSRSILQIMVELATMIDVPQEHVDKGITIPTVHGDDETDRRLMIVKCGDDEPEEAFASVNYHDQWFWIEDTDFKSKRTFAFLMILSSITESGGSTGLPLVTIPAG